MPSSVMTSYKKLDKPVGHPANKSSQRITEGALSQARKLSHYHKLGDVNEERESLVHPLVSGQHPGHSGLLLGDPMPSPRKASSSRFSLSGSGSSSSQVSSFDSPSKSRAEPVEYVVSNLANVSISPNSHKAAGLPTVAEEWSPMDNRYSRKVDIPDVPRSSRHSRSSRGSNNKHAPAENYYHLAAAAIDSSQDEYSFSEQELCEMSWDFEDDHGVFANGGNDVIAATGGAAAPMSVPDHNSVGNTRNALSKKKKVQIMEDVQRQGVISYRLRPDSICKVSFPARTWDTMMQSFRIALEMDNVFICDHFLGRDSAVSVFAELICLREGGHFARRMRTESSSNYACLSLSKEDLSHKHVDALALMVFKLANYYTSSWLGMSVDLSYFPEGHLCQNYPKQQESTRKQLKCMYFFDPDWDWTEEGEQNQRNTTQTRVNVKEYYGSLTIDAPSNKTKVDPVFDRLVVFWGDSLPHSLASCPKERFLVTLSLYR